MGFTWCVYIPVLPGLKSYKTVIINITILSHLKDHYNQPQDTSAIQVLFKDLAEQGSCAVRAPSASGQACWGSSVGKGNFWKYTFITH